MYNMLLFNIEILSEQDGLGLRYIFTYMYQNWFL